MRARYSANLQHSKISSGAVGHQADVKSVAVGVVAVEEDVEEDEEDVVANRYTRIPWHFFISSVHHCIKYIVVFLQKKLTRNSIIMTIMDELVLRLTQEPLHDHRTVAYHWMGYNPFQKVFEFPATFFHKRRSKLSDHFLGRQLGHATDHATATNSHVHQGCGRRSTRMLCLHASIHITIGVIVIVVITVPGRVNRLRVVGRDSWCDRGR